MRIERSRNMVAMAAPYRLDQCFSWHRAATVLKQGDGDVEFSRCQFDRLIAQECGFGHEIQTITPNVDRCWRCVHWIGTPQERAYSCDQFMATNGLDHIVVGTCIERNDKLLLAHSIRQEQHGEISAHPRTNPGEDFQSGNIRQVPVEHNQIEVVGFEEAYGFRTPRGASDIEPFGDQGIADERRLCWLVVNGKNLHWHHFYRVV
ncbi:hypothetical protein WI65_31830 [Burkholderia cepacia]|nr:hypothetical protein WI65_31830 [Burkholderia cepacia]